MTTQLETYLAGRDAFRVLSGDIDKDALKRSLLDGYAAVVMLADNGKSLSDIAAMHRDLSKSKVERDVRAGRTIATLPKVDPVLIVKACNAKEGTAKAINAAIAADKPAAALRAIVDGSNKTRREARPEGNDKGEKAEKEEKAPKTPGRATTYKEVRAWIARQSWTAEEWADLATYAAHQAQEMRKAAESVSKVS